MLSLRDSTLLSWLSALDARWLLQFWEGHTTSISAQHAALAPARPPACLRWSPTLVEERR